MANAYDNNMNGFINLKYEKNAAIHLVVGLFTTYIIIQSLYIIVLVTSASQHNVFDGVMMPNLGIQPWVDFVYRPWTILTYSLSHANFFEMITNLFWLYVFGNVIQSQIGYRNIIPLYSLSVLLSGLGYLAITYFVPRIPGSYYLLGFYAGNMAFVTAALTIGATYSVPLSRSLKIPTWLMALAYIALMLILFIPKNDIAVLVLCGLGGLIGILYGLIVKSGFDIGRKFYYIWDKTHDTFIPEEELAEEAALNNIDEATIATIQEKVRKEGINYLTTKEIDILNRWKNK